MWYNINVKGGFTMRMNNPSMRRALARTQNGELAVQASPATYGGIAWKSIYYAGITIVAAIASALLIVYAALTDNADALVTLLISAGVAAVAMLIFSIIIMFAPNTVQVVGTLYSLCQGFLLGMVSLLLNLVLPGVGYAAILGTAIVFLISVVMNKFLNTRIKSSFLQVMMISFISLIVVELIVTIGLMATGSESLFTAYFWIQLAITAFCVFYAAVMLMWDLQTANDIVQMGADKRYEWNVAFALVTTLVYLYIEILELLARLALIFGRNKN